MFLGSDTQSKSRTLHKLTGSENCKMTASKPDVSISILPANKMETKLQPNTPCIWNEITMFSVSSNTEKLFRILSVVWVCRKSKVAEVHKNYFSVSIYDGYEIQTDLPMFSGSRDCPTCGLESKMAPINFQLTHAICKSQLVDTSDSLHSNLVLKHGSRR